MSRDVKISRKCTKARQRMWNVIAILVLDIFAVIGFTQLGTPDEVAWYVVTGVYVGSAMIVILGILAWTSYKQYDDERC